MKKVLTNGIIIISMAMLLGISAYAQRVGGYKLIATDDGRVKAAAEFAVSKRTELHSEQEGLKLDSIDKAEIQVVAGSNYRLCLTVSIEDESQQIKAVVYQNLKKEYSLTSWEVEDCAETSSNQSIIYNSLILNTVNFTAIKLSLPKSTKYLL